MLSVIAVDSTTTRAHATRESLLNACDTLMARYGFRKMTMDDVAAEARVSKRTIYGYFPNKEELGLQSIGRVVEAVHAEMVAVANSEAAILDRIRNSLIQRVMGRVNRVQHYSNSLNELFEAVRPAYMARRQRYFEMERDLIGRLLQIGDEEGALKCDSPLETAEAMILATNALLPYSLSVRELGTPESIATRLERLIDLLVNGIRIKNKG